MAAFVIIPTIAVLYALFLPNGPNCGDAGSLAIDPVTGVAVNCDLTPYGVEIVDYFAMGQAEYSACAACHGENGGGAGNFPAFVGGSLLEAFPEGAVPGAGRLGLGRHHRMARRHLRCQRQAGRW